MDFSSVFKRDYRSFALGMFSDIIQEELQQNGKVNVLDLPSSNLIRELRYWTDVVGLTINHYVAFEINDEIEKEIIKQKHVARQYINSDQVAQILVNPYDSQVPGKDRLPKGVRLPMKDIMDLRERRSRKRFTILNFDLCGALGVGEMGIIADICSIHATDKFVLLITSSLRTRGGLEVIDRLFTNMKDVLLPAAGIEVIRTYGPKTYQGGTDGNNGTPMVFYALACEKAIKNCRSLDVPDNKPDVRITLSDDNDRESTVEDRSNAKTDLADIISKLPSLESVPPIPDELQNFIPRRYNLIWTLNWLKDNPYYTGQHLMKLLKTDDVKYVSSLIRRLRRQGLISDSSRALSKELFDLNGNKAKAGKGGFRISYAELTSKGHLLLEQFKSALDYFTE